jgi:UDP-N-acetylglucosamine 2-epimerase (non-hydrolysing)
MYVTAASPLCAAMNTPHSPSQRPLLQLVAGARPNFMKVAPLVRALQADGRFDWQLIHTGQHHDHEMSQVFFDELGIPAPQVHFGCAGGGHASQTARVMEAFEAHVAQQRPAGVLVVGDVNSTLACALVAKKAGLPLAHVEAGLRSGDRGMPEEINRLATDAISDWLFATEPAAVRNLLREGHPDGRVHHVGHVMVDNLLHQARQLDATDRSAWPGTALKRLLGKRYGVVTLHRPSNVDDPAALQRMLGALERVAAELPLVFPVHPRTRQRLQALPTPPSPRITLLPPQGYMAFLDLWRDAALVLTDSGGLQEETTALGVPCLTLRENTERPITVEEGSNTLAGTDPDRIVGLAFEVMRHGGRRGRRPVLWDGHAADRIVQILARSLA